MADGATLTWRRLALRILVSMGKIAGNRLRDAWVRLVSTLVIFTLLAGGIKGWEILDALGWIPHHDVTATYIGQNGWITGEYRDCIAVPTREGRLKPFVGIFGGFLSCDAEGHAKADLGLVTPHYLSITFWGKVTRSHAEERPEWRWSCRLNEAAVTCWAVN